MVCIFGVVQYCNGQLKKFKNLKYFDFLILRERESRDMMLDLKCKGLIDFRDVTNALDNFKNQDEDVKRIDLTSNDIRSVRHFLHFFIIFHF